MRIHAAVDALQFRTLLRSDSLQNLCHRGDPKDQKTFGPMCILDTNVLFEIIAFLYDWLGLRPQ